jgi:hypothetical protein
VTLENQSTASRTDGLQTGHRFLQNLGKVLGAVFLLALGLRFLNVFGLNAFLSNYDAAAITISSRAACLVTMFSLLSKATRVVAVSGSRAIPLLSRPP